MARSELKRHSIAAVIPAFRVAGQIAGVLRGLPPYIKHIIVVDDASTDNTAARAQAAARRDRRVSLLRHEQNQGVGGAMLTGFRKALDLDTDIVVKIDGDGQMDIALTLRTIVVPTALQKGSTAKASRPPMLSSPRISSE